MRFDDFIELKNVMQSYDSYGDLKETETWLSLGKCTILPNQAAQKQNGEDTEQRIYQYEVIMRKPKTFLPKEGSWVRLKKKNGTINTEIQVRGFVIYNDRFLKIWV